MEDDDEEGNPSSRVSSFRQIFEFPLLYKWACERIFFAPIHQQLVESVFWLYDKRTQKAEMREMDLVRLGQYRSSESRAIGRLSPTSEEIRTAGKLAVARAKAFQLETISAQPHASKQRKRDHNVQVLLSQARNKNPGSVWVCDSSAEEESSEGEPSESGPSGSSSDDEESGSD